MTVARNQELTRNQKRALEAIELADGRPVSLERLASMLGTTRRGASNTAESLVRWGDLTRYTFDGERFYSLA